MKMEILGKNIWDYANVVKIPLLVRIALALAMTCWAIATVFIGSTNTTEIVSIILWMLTIGIGIILAVYVGYNMARKKGNLINCALSGLMFGLIAGAIAWTLDIFSSIISIIYIGVEWPVISGYLFWTTTTLVWSIATSIGDVVLALIGGLIGGALEKTSEKQDTSQTSGKTK
jgi:hypothetical protein